MALTQKEISQLYVALLNRAADAGGVEFWQDQASLAEAAQAMIDSQAGTSFYPEDNRAFVEQIYENTVGLEGQEDADIQYWVDLLASGEYSRGELVAHMVNSIMDPAHEGTAFQESYLNRVAVSEYVAGLELDGELSVEELVAATTFNEAGLGVVRTESDAKAAQDKADTLVVDGGDTGPEVDGETIFLSVGQDIKTGTADNDLFVSYVSQNALGQQVNTLGSGDVLNGGAGFDTLDAQVTAGAWVNGGAATSNMAIAPVTKSVENIVLHAEIANYDTAGNNDLVIVNAKYMEGVNKIASNYSDASLLVQNLTSKGVVGGTANMTVGMEYTGNADTDWEESDMTVYFDQDYLTRSALQSNSLYYFTQDRLATNEDGKPFGEFTAVDGLQFRMQGQSQPIVVRIAEDKLVEFLANVPDDRIEAYQGFTDLLAEALALKNAEMNGALDGFTITLDTDFERTNGGIKNSGDPLFMAAPAITLTAPDNVEISSPAMYQNSRELPSYDMFNDVDDEQLVTDTPVRINVDLEKVGLAADGGALTIGSMNKDGANEFGNNQGFTVTDTVAGFDEFNVHVAGGKGQNSSLASLHSTDNTLRKVTVDSKAGGNANLTIGNSNSAAPGTDSASNATVFKDVQIMDASQFNGDLTLFAGITAESVEKYLENIYETTLYGLHNERNELALFEYKGGKGDDVLDIRIDGSIIDESLEDTADTNGLNVFQMKIDGGNGDDAIIVAMDAASAATNTNNASNITINGGLGNDVIEISEAFSTDWTFTVAFSGNHFGHDEIIGFDSGAVVVSDEVQELDLTGFVAHDKEAIVVKVGDKVLKEFAVTADMDATAIGDVVASILDASHADYSEAFFSTADSTTNPGVIALELTEANQNRVTVEVRKYTEGSGTWEVGTAPVHQATSTVETQGGIYGSTVGADVLDFTSYGAKGVVVVDETGALIQSTNAISAFADGDKAVYLVRSAHETDEDVFNVYTANVTDALALDWAAANQTSAQIIGSIDFDGNDLSSLDATQLLF